MNNIKAKTTIIWILSLFGLLGTAIFMLTIGKANIALAEIACVFYQQVFYLFDSEAVDAAYTLIVWDIRWPRIVLGILVGSSLAVSGACYQAIFKNPLADPFILGVSSGAALGAAIAIVLEYTAYISIFAFIGGTATIFLVCGLGTRKRCGDTNQMLLAGVAFGSLFNALLSTIMALQSKQISTILFWLMGNLTMSPEHLVSIVFVVLVGLCLLMAYARDLDLIATGDESALYLGVDVQKVKIIVLLTTTLITSTVVAMSGIIGFVGLIVPHLLRKIVGPQHRILLPLCAFWGATLLLWADGITRLAVNLSYVPVGIVTALLGSPVFLYILAMKNRS